MLSRTLSLVAILFLVASPSWSQDTRGAISGRISDASGAIIPNANIVVINPSNGSKLSLTSGTDGYRAPLLSPGTYIIEVAAAGFKKAIRPNVEVHVADRLDINIMMEIGNAAEQVTVTAGKCALPPQAKAYAANATILPRNTLGYITLWPADTAQPLVSTLNALDGAITANGAILPAAAVGSISLFSTDWIDLILDVSGFFAP